VEPRRHHFAQHRRSQLRAVVGADVGRNATFGGEALQDRDGLLCVDRAIDFDRQGLAGELVDDV